ncbi:MAG: hypothetical protein KDN20_05850 [Verrucomicrobiae bacterium]|nr:hypothetical protein [Verrucomicrobiae bacterium]
MTDPSAPICLAVLNPGGRDPSIDYAHGPRKPGKDPHPPINYHAYAAATKGGFFDRASAILEQQDRFDAVLVLIRSRVNVSLEAIRKLKDAGVPVLAAWKESGPYQIADQLRSTRSLEAYQDILTLADGILSPTAVLPPRWGWLSAAEFERKTRFIPTPYPLEFPEWDFGKPLEKREGIMVGTRQFFVPTRNHLHTLSRVAVLSEELEMPITVINGDKRSGRRLLRQLESSFPESRLHVVNQPLSYDRYLTKIASHRLVFQLDRSYVPGQVAGDAALCRTLCAGGNSALEGLIFPDLADDGSGSLEAVDDRLRILMEDAVAYEKAVNESIRRARDFACYGVVAGQLATFLKDLKEAPSGT